MAELQQIGKALQLLQTSDFILCNFDVFGLAAFDFRDDFDGYQLV